MINQDYTRISTTKIFQKKKKYNRKEMKKVSGRDGILLSEVVTL